MDHTPAKRIVGLILLAGFAACAGPAITDVASSRQTAQLASAGSALIECPTTETVSETSLVTSLGGIVTVGGTSISIPPGAVLEPTLITVTVPASTYMEVDVTANELLHFVFEQPVTISVSYARCTRGDIDKSPLSAWYIDSSTKTLLEAMGGVDDKVARTVTFTTGHLSGYALAN